MDHGDIFGETFVVKCLLFKCEGVWSSEVDGNQVLVLANVIESKGIDYGGEFTVDSGSIVLASQIYSEEKVL